MAELLDTVQVDAAAMRANIDRTRGLAFSEAVSLRLAATMGKAAAYAATEKLCERVAKEGVTLRDALNARLTEAELDTLFQPHSHYGDAPRMIERTVSRWRATRRGKAS